MSIEIKIPSPGESISEVTISSWLKADGDYVEKNDDLFEVESDKATLAVSAESSGVLKILIGEGQTAQVGAVAATIDPNGKTAKASAPIVKSVETPSPAPAKVPAVSTPTASSFAAGSPSPAAKKIMEEKSLKPEEVKASGPGGRITKADVLAHSGGVSPNGPTVGPEPAPVIETPKVETLAPAPAKTEITGSRTERREKMSKLRLKVSERLVAVKNQTAMLTTFNEVDMTAILETRKQYKDEFEKKHGARLGFMSFFTKAVTEALKSYPAINAFIDGDEVVYHDYVDVAVAVQAPKGLVVPVVRNAESLFMAEIEAEIARLALRARNNQLTIDEMTGGTFTISNGGVFGSLMSTPILNPPQSGILGMHKVEERPMAVNGQVVIRPMMYLAFSYDHRIIDGRESVGFLVKVKEFLENPVRILLGV